MSNFVADARTRPHGDARNVLVRCALFLVGVFVLLTA